MGGKKKTKWRKLPLEEIVPKDCPKLHERRRSEANKANIENVKEQDAELRVPGGEENSSLNVNPDYNENQDGIWYPTHYLIYNPVEVPMYPNYFLPSDCYYYPSNDSMQEYATVQEYIPPVKDTIYLLFPTSALPQTSPFDWRNRRRRRRYGGYAEYAVIPEKNHTDVKRSSEKCNIESSEIKTFSTLKQSSSSEKYLNTTQEANVVKVHMKAEKISELKNKISNDDRNGVNSNKAKKSIQVCGVHSKYPERKDISLNSQDLSKIKSSESSAINNLSLKQKDTMESLKQVEEVIQTCDTKESFEDQFCTTETNQNSSCFEQETCNSDIKCKFTNIDFESKIQSENCVTRNVTDTPSKCELYPNPESDTFSCRKNKNLEQDRYNFIQTSLPDILNTSNKTHVPHCTKSSSHLNITRSNTTITAETLEDKASVPSQSSVSRISDPNGLNRETESKGQTKSPPPAQINSSIYKLAFDESLDSESRSPSPIDPESQMPSSLVNHEINIYEADSGDEAGSEDLELIPHRYESESFLTKSKHVYENKLSLAVELLRTKETLPYDSQFKRVSEENFQDSTGAVNLGFVDDLSFLNSFESKKADSHKLDQIVITNQCQTHVSLSPNASFEIPLENSLTNSCEIADEAVPQADGQQENTDEVKAGYRSARFHHYFSPSSSLLNPFNCCIVM